VYLVKNGDAKELAGALGKHFKGEAEFQALPSSSNALLISSNPAVFEEVVKVLGTLDRRPHVVSVELLIAEVQPAKSEVGKPAPARKELEEKEFTGTSKEIVEKVQDLKKRGLITGLKRFQLTTLENQPGTMSVSESRPSVVGISSGGRLGGVVSQNISYRNVGTQAKVTARVTDGRTVMLDVEVEESRLNIPEDGIVLGKDENGVPVRATEYIMSSLKGKLSVPSGRALAARGVRTEAKSGQAQTLIIVTASILEPEGKESK